MKKSTFNINKKIMTSASMLLVSALMLSSTTYAWFTMNKTVSVTGMKLKATAEDGLVISDYAKTTWATSKDIQMSTSAVLAPTSTSATASPAWVRNSSANFDNADADQTSGYEDLTLAWSTEAADSGSIGSVTVGSVTKNYVLHRTFYIKATGDSAWVANPVIDEVTATVSSSNTNSGDLDKSLRVLVVVTDGTGTNSNAFIYAPISGATTSYNWKGTTTNAVAVSAVASTTDSTCTNITSIPAGNTANPLQVDMYLYFEGEDAACKSSNISGISVDELTVSAKFKTSEGPSDPTPTP